MAKRKKPSPSLPYPKLGETFKKVRTLVRSFFKSFARFAPEDKSVEESEVERRSEII